MLRDLAIRHQLAEADRHDGYEIFVFEFDYSKRSEPMGLTVSEGYLMQALSDLQACQRHIDGYESTAYHSELCLRCTRENVEELHQELERGKIFKMKYIKTRRTLQVWSSKHEKLHTAY